ncbi:for meiotic nuclear division protein 1 homolog [Seminavis robusta]|uniref:For meiotic nuclear division protein 1 homolog n=1 Tax=Seminavis robusta TaxID=568900 RepID=A0A9N8DVN9_9STRA|nr:for meiotic nuclear division protein 1 homolog [Seminavis robusta]|eukprot:Sro378_g130190.1 for meiotic nuclear division protein 1 homolog (367) ;mRNA; r:12562-13662
MSSPTHAGEKQPLLPRRGLGQTRETATDHSNRILFPKQARARKAVAEFRKKTRPPTPWEGRVGMHLPVDEIDIEQVAQSVTGWKALSEFEVVRLFPDTTTTSSSTTQQPQQHGEGEELPEIFVFSFGACIFWNFPNEAAEKEWISQTLLQELNECCGDSYKDDEIQEAMDSVSFQYYAPPAAAAAAENNNNNTSQPPIFTIKRDVCTLSTKESGEKLAVSFALAKSSLLSLYELRVQQVIERNSHLPEEMVQKGRVHMSTHDLTREIGRLFLVKHGINLDQSLIDTPEEFWEDDRFESTYDTTLKYFKITKRLDLVNERLDMVGELHNKILEENHTHHAVVLEWIIIILIVMEVLIEALVLVYEKS